MREKIAARLRRVANRIHPIPNSWTNGDFADPDGHERAWLELETDGHAHGTAFKINGKPVLNCIGVSFSIKADETAHATVELEDVPIRFVGRLEQDGAPSSVG